MARPPGGPQNAAAMAQDLVHVLSLPVAALLVAQGDLAAALRLCVALGKERTRAFIAEHRERIEDERYTISDGTLLLREVKFADRGDLPAFDYHVQVHYVSKVTPRFIYLQRLVCDAIPQPGTEEEAHDGVSDVSAVLHVTPTLAVELQPVRQGNASRRASSARPTRGRACSRSARSASAASAWRSSPPLRGSCSTAATPSRCGRA